MAGGLQLVFVPLAVAGEPPCREKRLADEFRQTSYISTLAPTARINIEQRDFHQSYKDIVAFQPGHRVSLSIAGRIDINRHYWSERKCKWFGLKCWYEPRQRSNWQGIEDRPILAKLCLPGEGRNCKSDLAIGTMGYEGLRNVPELQVRERKGLQGLTPRFELNSLIEGSGVDRSVCTGARPSTCSFGEYIIGTRVDVKPRVLALEKLLGKPQNVDDLVGTDVVDDFTRRSDAARKVVACLYFGHTQRFHPEVPGSADSRRERLLKFIVGLDPDNEYRVELTSLLITSGAIDEALEGAERELNEARKRYQDSNQGESEANAYAKALLNRARLWIEDRVATEGADLEVAVGLLSELARVRKAMLEKVPWDEERREELVRAQIEQARLLSLIRTRPMLTQAEKGLTEALQWIPLDKSEEIAGENAARKLYASYSASSLPLPAGRPLKAKDTEPAVAPAGFVHVHRVPSWSAQPNVLTQLGDAIPSVMLADGVRNGDDVLWHPDARQNPRSWRLFGNAHRCKHPKRLYYLGGSVGKASIQQYTHALFFLDPDGAVLVHRPSGDAACVLLEPGVYGPTPTVRAPPRDDPETVLPKRDDPLTVDGAARLIYAKQERLFWLDAETGTDKPQTIPQSAQFDGLVQRIVASTDDQSVGVVVRDGADDGGIIRTIVMPTVHDAVSEEKKNWLQFQHPIGEGGLFALSSTLAFVRRDQSLDVFTRAELAKNGDGVLSAVKPVFSIDIGDTSREDLFVHALGDDFAVLQLRTHAGKDYGTHNARLDVRVGDFRYETELGPQDAVGFKRGVLLSLEGKTRDRFTVRLFAAGVNGVLHRTRLHDGLRIESTRALGLTSERAVVLNATAMLLSTHVAEVGEPSTHRNVPWFNGHQINKVSQFCVEHSRWGCRVAPISVPVPKEATGSRSGCGRDGVWDPIILVAVGHDGGTERAASSDVVARARVSCDDAGRPKLVGGVELLDDEFPEIVKLESESGQEYDGPVWRHVGPTDLVVPASAVVAFAALPHQTLDPDDKNFGDRTVLQVPVRLVRETKTLAGTVALRSPYGVRHLLARTTADGEAVENALVVADYPNHVVTYTGAAETPDQFAKLLPRSLVQARFGADGNALLLGKADVDKEDGRLVRFEHATQGSGFTSDTSKGMNAVHLMTQWNPSERAAGYMRFEFFGATPDLKVIWRPDGPCTVVERPDGKPLKFGVGRPAGISHLRGETMTTPIIIQGVRLPGTPKSGLRRGLPFTQFWSDLTKGARAACGR